MSEWFGAEVVLVARTGARATFRWADGRERGAIVEEVEPGRRLSFRWMPFARGPGGDVQVVGSGRVELLLERSGPGSILTVVEWGTERRPSPELLHS